jgi:hypothetical protein
VCVCVCVCAGGGLVCAAVSVCLWRKVGQEKPEAQTRLRAGMKRCLCRVFDVSLSCMPLSLCVFRRVFAVCLSCPWSLSHSRNSHSYYHTPPPFAPPPAPPPPPSLSRACTLNHSLSRARALPSSVCLSLSGSLARSLSLCGCRSWEEYMKTGDATKDEQTPTIAAVLLTL